MVDSNFAPRVLFAASEAAPYVKTGGLGDVAGALPAALAAAGAHVALVLPRYGQIEQAALAGEVHLHDIQVPMPHGNVGCSVSMVPGEVDVYLLGADGLFVRDEGIYGFDDDLYRFAFFSRAICECMLQVEGFAFDIIHCNDWQTALVPVYLKSVYARKRACMQVKTVFTVHNAMFQGKGAEDALYSVLDLGGYPAAASTLATDSGSVNLMRGALALADWVTTVSPTYVRELETAEYGEGLESAFRRRGESFSGILNGIDLGAWNPETDEYIAARYSVDDMRGKGACKAELQEELGLAARADVPLIAMVTRLTDQKGVGLVCQALERILEHDVQFAVLGTGDVGYEGTLRANAAAHPGKMAAAIRFDNGLSHRIYAGADMLLMPSLFEPCGLSQMNAMRYGTLPVVRETGGLRDSVVPYNKYTGEGTGFSFANAYADEMASILLGACELYATDASVWAQLQSQAMRADFSWTKAAREYLGIYAKIAR